MTAEIRRVMVIGAGTMGAGIAEVCARAGLATFLSDVDRETIAQGMDRIHASLTQAIEKEKIMSVDAEMIVKRIDIATDYEPARGADLIIEAVFESMPLKKEILGEVSKIARDAILASNTSSLSVTEIAQATAHPERFVGLHFFNPTPIMPLLEIVRAEQTSGETLATVSAFAKRVGKTSIVVRDMPGFATSRLGIALGMEAIRMLETGVASVVDIDRAMELGYRHPMGPLMLTDLVGLDVRLAIADHLAKELGAQFAPPPLLRQLVRAGRLGKKSGRGFYDWTSGKPVAIDRERA